MAKTMLTMELPKIGDHLMRIMTEFAREWDTEYIPKPCTVTYVNKANGWYQVQFDDTGIRECYGLPVYDHSIIRKETVGRAGVPIACIETGEVYSNIKECARDMHLDRSMVDRQVNGEYDHCCGYHFIKVL